MQSHMKMQLTPLLSTPSSKEPYVIYSKTKTLYLYDIILAIIYNYSKELHNAQEKTVTGSELISVNIKLRVNRNVSLGIYMVRKGD